MIMILKTRFQESKADLIPLWGVFRLAEIDEVLQLTEKLAA